MHSVALQAKMALHRLVFSLHIHHKIGFELTLLSYLGPFAAKTAHPLLIVGNTVDNVTPLRNAQKLSESFPESVMLHQDSWGHCTYSSPSLCTGRVLRKYFQTGELPEPGTICPVSRRAFDGFTEEDEPRLGAADNEKDLEKALVGLWQNWP